MTPKEKALQDWKKKTKFPKDFDSDYGRMGEIKKALDIALKEQAKQIFDDIEKNMELSFTREIDIFSEEKQFILTRSKLRNILKDKWCKNDAI